MNDALIRPEPRRLVPRAVVDALIADADREISSLELQLERALVAAKSTEGRLAELGVDERASAWATVQLERFVTELRSDADAESVAVVEEARVRARMLIEEAEAEVRHLRRVAAARRSEPEPEPATPDNRALFGTPIPIPAPAPIAESSRAVDVTPDSDSEHGAEPERAPAPSAPVLADPLTTSAAPADPEGQAYFNEISPEALASDERALAPLDADFWPADAERKRRFPRARVRSVVAPTLAGLLVVAAVVVRVV